MELLPLMILRATSYRWSPLGGVLPLSITNPSLFISFLSFQFMLHGINPLLPFLTLIMTKISSEIYVNMGPHSLANIALHLALHMSNNLMELIWLQVKMSHFN